MRPVAPSGGVACVFTTPNPKRARGNVEDACRRYYAYMPATSLEAYFTLGGHTGDLRYDIGLGYCTFDEGGLEAGTAVILVDRLTGDNSIVVAPGANFFRLPLVEGAGADEAGDDPLQVRGLGGWFGRGPKDGATTREDSVSRVARASKVGPGEKFRKFFRKLDGVIHFALAGKC